MLEAVDQDKRRVGDRQGMHIRAALKHVRMVRTLGVNRLPVTLLGACPRIPVFASLLAAGMEAGWENVPLRMIFRSADGAGQEMPCVARRRCIHLKSSSTKWHRYSRQPNPSEKPLEIQFALNRPPLRKASRTSRGKTPISPYTRTSGMSRLQATIVAIPAELKSQGVCMSVAG